MAQTIDIDTGLILNNPGYKFGQLPVFSDTYIDQILSGDIPGFVTVRKVHNDRYEALTNYRLLQAIRQANAPKTPVVVIENLSEEEVRQIIEMESVKLPSNIIDEAKKYATEVKPGPSGRYPDNSIKFLAVKYNKSQPYISNTLRLLKLPSEFQDLIKAGTISAAQARALLQVVIRLKDKHKTQDFDHPELRKDLRLLRSWVLAEKPSSRQIEQRFKKSKKDSSTVSNKPLTGSDDPNIRKLESYLTEKLGAKKVSMNQLSLHIHCHDLDKLQEVLELLGYRQGDI